MTRAWQRSPVEAAGGAYLGIAVCGAHLHGLPLNGQLTTRGGRLVARTRTAAAYRIYLLPGEPPLRPGLVRDAGGRSLEVEVWDLPIGNVGSFLGQIPAPLGLGKLELQDGSWVIGFICEPHGIQGAQEITAWGGWRAFLESRRA